MKKVLLVAVLVAALGIGSASFAQSYAGGAVGYMASSGFTFMGQFGDWSMLGPDMGLRARLGISVGFGFGIAGGVDFTYNLGQIFSPDLPMILYIVGGPEVSYAFVGVLGLAINAGAGIQYNFADNIGAFLETKPVGVGFVLAGPVSAVFWAWSFSSGVNFTF